MHIQKNVIYFREGDIGLFPWLRVYYEDSKSKRVIRHSHAIYECERRGLLTQCRHMQLENPSSSFQWGWRGCEIEKIKLKIWYIFEGWLFLGQGGDEHGKTSSG